MRLSRAAVAVVIAAFAMMISAQAMAEAPIFVEKGRVYTFAKGTFNFVTGSYYDYNRDLGQDFLNREYTEQFVDLGVMYGFVNNFDITFAVQMHTYQRTMDGADDGNYFNFNFVNLGLRWRIPTDVLQNSLELVIMIPCDDGSTEYNSRNPFAGTLRYMLRKDFANIFFLQSDVAFRWADVKGMSNFTWGAEAGFTIVRYFNLGLRYYGDVSFDGYYQSVVETKKHQIVNPFTAQPSGQEHQWMQAFIYSDPVGDLEFRLAYNYLVTGRNAFLQNGLEFMVSYKF
ncbi:MAG: hypothetical protein WC889_18710 [Myxococcota bacterium]|jgi:hypothetical protein